MRISVATVCALAAIFAEDSAQPAAALPILPSGDQPPTAKHSPSIAVTKLPKIESPPVALSIATRWIDDRLLLPQLPQPELPQPQLPTSNATRSLEEILPVPTVEIPRVAVLPPENIAPPEPIALPEPRLETAAQLPDTRLMQMSMEGAIEIPVPPAAGEAEQKLTPPEAVPAAPIAPLPEASPTQPIDPANLEELSPNANPLQLPTQIDEVRTRDVVPITLAEAVELARRNNLDLRVAELELQRTQAALQEAQAANEPTVDATADATTSPASEDFDDDNTSLDAVLGGSLGVNYDLYTAGRRSALIRAAEGQRRSQELQVEIISETIELDIINAYYDLQQADEQVRIAQAALAQSERSLRDAIALEQAGIGTRFDRVQTEVDVANSRQELLVALSQQQVVRRQIKRRLNINESIGVLAADPIAMAGTWTSSLEETVLLAYQNRAELEQQLVQRGISQQQQRAALAELEPQVSVFANVGLQNSLSRGDGFNDDLQLGARVRLRLFDGGAARARAAQEAANATIAEVRFADARNQIRFEVEEAYLSLRSNLENTQTAAQAVEAATTALELARLRFQAGVDTQTDVSRLQAELTRAEGNRLQTILGYNRALASLQRAVNQLSQTSDS